MGQAFMIIRKMCIRDRNLYTAYLAKLLEMSGEESKAAAENAQAYFELEKTLSENQLERQEYGDVDKVYNVYTPQQLQDLFPAADIARILKDAGFSAPSRIIAVSYTHLDVYKRQE